MKSSAVPATLFCTALMLAPLCGGAGSAKATTAIAQQTGIVKGTVVDANGEAVIGASVIIEGQKHCFVSGFCLLAHLLVLLLPEPFSLFIGKITQKNPLYLIIYAKKYVLCAEMYKKTNIRIIILISATL